MLVFVIGHLAVTKLEISIERFRLFISIIVMKKISYFIFFLFFAASVYAQENTKDVIFKRIPQNLNIKDKVIIQNKSPYYILQIVVAVPDKYGSLEPLGSATFIAPNETYEMVWFRKKYLKKLRGKTIAVKVKGTKKIKIMGEGSQTKILTPFGSVGVGHQEVDPEIINNIDPSDVTYEFNVNFAEARHDLYIEVFNSGGNGVMDF